MSKVMHQMSANAERAGVARGEAPRDPVSDETQGTTHDTESTGSGLLLQALTRQNLLKAMKRVKANKGAAGADGMDIDQTFEYLKHHWPRIRAELLAGTYRPSPVRRVAIPKPGGGERELGIPTVVDRLIQQALLQSKWLDASSRRSDRTKPIGIIGAAMAEQSAKLESSEPKGIISNAISKGKKGS